MGFATLTTSGYWLRSGRDARGGVARFGSMPGMGRRDFTAFLPGTSLKDIQPNMPPSFKAASKSGRFCSRRKTFFLIGCRPRALTAAFLPRRISSSAATPHGQFAAQLLQFRHIAMMWSNSAEMGILPERYPCIREILPRATICSFLVSR